MSNTPKVAAMEVFPVAGKDCMELNLSGAHAPYFTRNVVVLTDDRGNTGIGEVPGGQKITKALEDVKHLVEGTSVADYKMTCAGSTSGSPPTSRTTCGDSRPSTCAPASTWSPPWRPPCWICWASTWRCPWPPCWATASSGSGCAS